MKMILREYLASLRERGELDVILPDLLSQLGLNVFSRPGRGTRQDGVDVAAVGKIGNQPEKVYLFSVKAGDLTRKEWDGNAIQSLRPSLNEILDAYIPTRLPVEHRGKEIAICICVGGDIREQVRQPLEGFIEQNTKGNISFEKWNGDHLASLIQTRFLRASLLPLHARSLLRKSLALIDEPEAAYKHFSALIRILASTETFGDTKRVRAIRQINICLWILFAWSRDAKNMESAYRSSELALLCTWRITNQYVGKKNKTARAIHSTFNSILACHEKTYTDYLAKCVTPHLNKRHGLSSAVRGSNSLDINLKLFDVLGRLAMHGIWSYWGAEMAQEQQPQIENQCREACQASAAGIRMLIENNPALLLPIKDEQAIDVGIAAIVLATDPDSSEYLRSWLTELASRSVLAYRSHGNYPCNQNVYHELLEHPQSQDDQYRERVTQGSILYPLIATLAALFDYDELYENIGKWKHEHWTHCNFQYWYPDDLSEAHIYANTETHGTILSNIGVDRTKHELLAQVFQECDHSSFFQELSAVKFSYFPLVLMACRHYRLPIPLQFLQGFRRERQPQDSE